MTDPWLPVFFRQFCLLIALASGSGGMEIRGYSSERHDRFTGFPNSPAWNPNAWYDSNLFQAVGWIHNNSRQFALVTRQHIVCATHFAPAVGAVIRFLAEDGSLLERSTVSVHPIPAPGGGNTDLALCKLSSPIPASSGISPFPYLNLASESQYLNRSIFVFGASVRVGKGTIAGFGNNAISGKPTRVFYFHYYRNLPIDDVTRDDCYLESGDSGSPSFALHEGLPALLSIHTVVVPDPPFYILNTDSFIPHYISQCNDILATEGYRMIPAIRETTTLVSSSSSDPSDLKSGEPGSVSFTVENTGSALTGNLQLELHFPPDLAPASISAPGWIVESANGGSWVFRRATLEADTALTIAANWTQLPEADSISVNMIQRSDGSAEVCRQFNYPLEITYAAWASLLDDPDPLADADDDGVPNLLEYAFGGDPLSGSRAPEGAVGSLPVFSVIEGRAGMSFPVRKDAAQRQLSYEVEFSDLLSESWNADSPAGWSQEEVEFDPPSEHFVQRRVSFEASQGASFTRVRVNLANE